tara:strand:+ start:9521 stop:9700 length:180 start_codon:yes stop_codon:yes gene_type:complete
MKIEKKVKITIEGEEVKVLSKVCSLAHVKLKEAGKFPCGFEGESVEDVKKFIDEIFENT